MPDVLDDLKAFYDLLDKLEHRLGRKWRLGECKQGMGWPNRGVYFFFDDDEKRSGSGSGLRVVRVGTHAIQKPIDKTTLWERLYNHKTRNHRSSMFRDLVGEALRRRHPDQWPRLEKWGVKGMAWRKVDQEQRKEIRAQEMTMETEVSRLVHSMPFLWIKVDDKVGPDSNRAIIERNAIGLLSQSKADPASRSWLGKHSSRQRVCKSGLWCNEHVFEGYERKLLEMLKWYIDRTDPL